MSIEYFDNIRYIAYKVSEYRYGQALFNKVYRDYPHIADHFRGTDTDPFYDDSKVDLFLNGCKNKFNEYYFVASEVDEPVRMFFDKETAFNSKYEFIDSFDNNGEKYASYKLIGDNYTTLNSRARCLPVTSN